MSALNTAFNHLEPASAEGDRFNSAILTVSPDCIVCMDYRGVIISLNQAAELTFGYSRTDMLGRRLADVITPPEWRARDRYDVEQLLSAGESALVNRRIELVAMRADGSTFPIELHVVPLSVDGEMLFTAFIRDISAAKQSQAMLKDSAMRYRQLVELSPEATFVYRDDTIVLFNQAASRLLGMRDPRDLLGRRIFDFIHPAFHAVFAGRARLRPEEACPTPFMEQVWVRENGSEVHVEIGATNLLHGDLPSVHVVVRDITERKSEEALQCGQNRILNMVATGAALDDILLEISRFAESRSEGSLICIRRLEAEKAVLAEGIAPRLPKAFLTQTAGMPLSLRHSGRTPGSRGEKGGTIGITGTEADPLGESHGDLALRHGLHICGSWPVPGRNAKSVGVFSVYFREPKAPAEKDLRLYGICARLAGIAIESRATEERIRYLAHYDGLTGLPNRFLFKEFLELALRRAQRHGSMFAVLFLDLDRFKEINDTLGHDAGDMVLREMAKRLQGCLRQSDKIARMGGDEFYVLVDELEDGRYATEVARKLLDAAALPISIADREWRLSVSIGIALFPDDGDDGTALLKNADQAMYRAKGLGKNAFETFSRPETERGQPGLRAHSSGQHLRAVPRSALN